MTTFDPFVIHAVVSGVAEAQFGHPDELQEFIGTMRRGIPHRCYLRYVYPTLGSPPTGDTVDAEVMVNQTTVLASWSFPIGGFFVHPTNRIIELAPMPVLDAGDYLTINVTNVGFPDAGSDLSVTCGLMLIPTGTL